MSTEIDALTAAIDACFFPPAPDAAEPSDVIVALAGTAMADAVASLEDLVDTLGDDVAFAAFVVLGDLRAGMRDRAEARMGASMVLCRLASQVDVGGAARPLVELLGALASLPDVHAENDAVFDPSPDPLLPIEGAIAQVLHDPGQRGALRRAIETADLHVPVLDLGLEAGKLAVRFLPVIARGLPMISVFTSASRFEVHGRTAGVGDVPLLEIEGSELGTLCPPGHGVIINPGFVLGCALSEAEVRALPDAPCLVAADGLLEVRPLDEGPFVDVERAVTSIVAAGIPGVVQVTAAIHGERDVVLAVRTDPDTTPEEGIGRVGVALARAGIDRVAVVHDSSAIGARVLAVAGRSADGPSAPARSTDGDGEVRDLRAPRRAATSGRRGR